VAKFFVTKRFIVGGIIVANALTTVVTIWVHPPQLDFSYWFGVATYWPMLLILPFSRSDKLDITLLLIMIGGYLATWYCPQAGYFTN
jgi:hypothetical protein